MAGFIDRIIRPRQNGGQTQGPGNVSAEPSPLRTGNEIGAGGEGTVYEDEDDPRMAIKVLHPDRATPEHAEKLLAMRDNPPPNPQTLGWPNLVQAEIGKKELRYRMPRAPGGSVRMYRFTSANERRQLPPHQQEYEHRTKLGVKIAEAFRQLHTIHVRIGDVNPLNILVSHDSSVMLIDCDSFQIPHPSGGQPYPCVVGSPEYTAPEIDDFRRQFRSQDSDNFALAVLLYQLLGDGSHPYQGIDERSDDSVSGIRARIKEHRFAHQPGNNRWHPTKGQLLSWKAMPTPVRDAFQAAFSADASEIGRPAADAWVSILEQNPYPAADGENQPASPPDPTPNGAGEAGREGRNRIIRAAAGLAMGAAVLTAVIMAFVDNPGGSDENRIAILPSAVAAGSGKAPVNPEAEAPANLQGSTGQTYEHPTSPRPGWVRAPTPDVTAVSRALIYTMTVPPAATLAPTSALEPTATPIPTATLVPTAEPAAAPTPEPTATPMPAATLVPTATPVPAAPTPTLAPTELLLQHPAHPKIIGAKAGTWILLQGCYLGNRTAARKFRLASWDVWDPGRYGSELKFVKIITNNGAQLPLEQGACYEARVKKHVDSDEEYVCLDQNAVHSQQYPCDNYRENEVMPTFILYPNSADGPENFTDSFDPISKPPSD